jgi:hypothetical protein
VWCLSCFVQSVDTCYGFEYYAFIEGRHHEQVNHPVVLKDVNRIRPENLKVGSNDHRMDIHPIILGCFLALP